MAVLNWVTGGTVPWVPRGLSPLSPPCTPRTSNGLKAGDMTMPVTPTLAYYAHNAEEFVASTVDVDFSATQKRFATLLPERGRVLDLGCGSGRDARWFLIRGFDVTATDGSPELASVAQRVAGIPVRVELFGDLADVEHYDGVWACSSILHLPKQELADVLGRIERALVPKGVLYTSFKYGNFEGMRNGRHFTDFTEPVFREFVTKTCNLAIEDLWISGDVRPGRSDERWLNVIMRKA